MRAAHALNRLAFGPRPGDVERVQQIGVDKWIELQLHPEKIDDPVVEPRLASFRTLRMRTQEIVENFPPEQLIKQIADGKAALPRDPTTRAVYEAQLQRYEDKQERKQEAAKSAPGSSIPTGNNSGADKDDASGSSDPDQMRRERRRLANLKSQELLDLPADERMKEILKMSPEDQRTLISTSKGPRADALLEGMNPKEKETLMALNNPQQVVVNELMQAKLLRAIYSERQLDEVMTDFWINHFNIFINKGADRYLLTSYERDAIRPHVLGKFEDLLVATAKSPAMMFYLDNWLSVGPDSEIASGIAGRGRGYEPVRNNHPRGKGKKGSGLNENYGRELMELHTLGVNGGYTQQDVTEVARCFTGWTILEPRKGGGFFFNDKLHDKGEKVVLGHVIPAGGGMDDGEKVLDILATHPSTARFISKELAQRFVADNPPGALVERMAQTFLATGGDIREVMKTMLDSKEFWSQGAYRAKLKTPFEMVASSVRALGADVTDAWALANQVGNLGEPLYRKQEPTGYSNLNSEWVNSAALLNRLNFALQLAKNGVVGVKVDTRRFGNNPEMVAKTLMYRSASPQTRAAINKALLDQKQKTPALVAGLVIGSPDFQRR